MSTTANIIVYGLLAGVSTCVGMGLLLWKERWALRHLNLLTAFAAGAILSVVFFHVLPEAAEVSEHYLFYCAAGFIAFFILENILVVHGSVEHAHEVKGEGHLIAPTAWVTALGIGLHSLLDGIIIGIGFDVDFRVGLVTTIGLISHEVPEGIAILGLLFGSQVKRRQAIVVSMLVAAATPVGAFLSLVFVSGLPEAAAGALLAGAGGILLYVSASDLIPSAHRQGSKLTAVALLAGVALLALTKHLLGE